MEAQLLGRLGDTFLHTLDEERLQTCLDRLDQSGLPNLWIPRPQSFFKVDAIPYLGTGKLDLRKIREVAAGLANSPVGQKM